MRKAVLAVFMALFFVGCTKTLYVPVERVRTVTETVRDTVIDVRLEKEYVKQTVPDTTSTVETKYARAMATWHGDKGWLEHEITTKEEPVAVKIKYVDRLVVDSIPAPYPVYVDKPVEKPVRMPLRWYEKLFMYIGMAAAGGGVVWLLSRFRK